MEKQEIIELVVRIQNVDGSEDEIDEMIDTFLKNVPDPNAADYLFEKDFEDLSAEEIVEKALSYQSFKL